MTRNLLDEIIIDLNTLAARIKEYKQDKDNFLPHPWTFDDLMKKYRAAYDKETGDKT